MPAKQAYLRLNTKKFLEVWIQHLQKSKEKGEPPSLPIFANQIAAEFRDAPENVPYKQENGADSITGVNIWQKVINKCRSINASLKTKHGKTLPVPRGDGRAARQTVSELLAGIEGGADFLS